MSDAAAGTAAEESHGALACEVVAVGTELLLGQIVDTNSAWIGEQLAVEGIVCRHQTKVGDNLDRIVAELRRGVDRSGAVICCGGLGPTHDDLTRPALAALMGVELEFDDEASERIAAMFSSRGRSMPASNLSQAWRPAGSRFLAHQPGTAPGLLCELPRSDGSVGVVYAVPGVPWEMKEMIERDVLPDLRSRAGVRGVILSRTLRTWGATESAVGESLQPRIEALDRSGRATIALLASGIEGIKVRLTVRARTEGDAAAILDSEVAAARSAIGESLVFGEDDDTMESVVLGLLASRSLTLGTAESLTGGLIASRLASIPGASAVFRGSVVAYSVDVKRELLGVPDGPVVSEETARAMAVGAQRVLACDAVVATTGVAGPGSHEGVPAGTACLAAVVGDDVVTTTIRFPGRRQQVREFCSITVLDLLRSILLDRR